MAKVLCVLYDDPVGRLPAGVRARRHPEDRALPRRPDHADARGDRLHARRAARQRLRRARAAQRSSRSAATASSSPSDKDGADSEFERELPDADVVISQPFWPAYLTAERIAKAPKLKLAITAGIGSDHVDLQAAIERGITVAEVTYCNSISVSEHVVMMILALVRNYIPSYKCVVDGGWNIADCVSRSYDLEGMQVGTVGARADRLRRAAPAEAVRGRAALHRPPPAARRRTRSGSASPSTRTPSRWCSVCDVVTINAPLHPETEHLFDDELIGKMKRGAYLVNTARGKICDRDAVVRALETGQLAGYAGDVWFPQPAPAGPPVAHDAAPRHDAAHVGHEPLGAGALRRRHARDPRVLVRRPADPRGVPDRRRRQARRRRRALLQRISGEGGGARGRATPRHQAPVPAERGVGGVAQQGLVPRPGAAVITAPGEDPWLTGEM